MNRKRIWIVLMIMAIAIGSVAGYYGSKPERKAPVNASYDQQKKLAKQQNKKCRELTQHKGQYDEKTIVLSDTTESRAKALADKMDASMRMTPDKGFAVLTLPKGVDVADIYSDKDYRKDLSEMSLDYHVKTSAVDANQHELYTKRADYSVNDPDYDKQSELEYLDLQDTWKKNKGDGVTVAVIDTGIDTDHEEFKGRISKLSYNASEDKVVKDYDMSVIEDEQGHGTKVAGTLGAALGNEAGITGIAPEAELLVIKCDADANGNFLKASDLVFGLAYAIEVDVDVVNMSFGTEQDIFSKYTKLAVDSDVICVASAGNDSTGLLTYPAADENVIGVGAMDSDWELASYSNYGDNSDLVAHGTAYTTEMGGKYGYAQGTSLASPMVAAAAALYRKEHSDAEFKEIKDYLIASSVDLGSTGEDMLFGYGALDIYAFLYEEKGTITYEMQTDEIKNQTQPFVKGHTVQLMLEPEREDVVFDGWYYDRECTDEVEYYTDIFSEDVTLYAKWTNEDDANAYTYSTLTDGTVKILSYTGKRKYIKVPDTIEGKNVSCIGEAAFANNNRLRKINLPANLTKIMPYAFQGCSRLMSIDIPESVQSIESDAFYGCARMNSVGIAAKGNLQSIQDSAFAQTMISSFVIPQNFTTLGKGVFLGCRGMKKISVAEGNTSFQIKEQAVYDSTGTKLLYCPTGLSGSYQIAEGTKEIGMYAFAYARMTQIDLADSLVSLGESSFEGAAVNDITIPSSIQNMGRRVFAYSALISVNLPENSQLNKISEEAFSGCQMTSVSIPKSVTQIENNAFMGTGLKSIQFNEGTLLKEIGAYAFMWSRLQKIVIPDAVVTIDEAAFENCYDLGQVVFGQNSHCVSFGAYLFQGDEKLKQVVIPNSVQKLGECCFYQSGLEEIEVGAGLTDLGEGALSGCQNLESIAVDKANTTYGSYDGVLFDAAKTNLLFYPAAKSGEYTLPKTTVRIAGYAFAGAKKLTEIAFNEGLKKIGRYAFADCEGLQTPEFPQGLESIEENAFEYCSGMTEKCLIPKTVKDLGRFAFAYDYNLTKIEMEADSQLNRLGYGVFGYCGIEDFTVPENVSTMGQEVFTGCNNLVTVTFEGESQLERIAAWTFQGADALRRITFEQGSSLAVIEARALEGLSALNHVDLKYCTKLKEIDNYAFNHCISLSDITLPQSLTTIGRYAFQGCSVLKKMTIPATVTKIGRYAFAETGKIEVYFKASLLPENLEENWNQDVVAYYLGVADIVSTGDWEYALTDDGNASIVAYHGSATDIALDQIDGHDVISIGGKVFKNNTALHSITLPDTLTGIYQSAFEGTTDLDQVIIPASVRVIDDYAFDGSGITKVTFAENSELSILGRYAFAKTEKLAQITLPKGLTKVKDYAFYNSAVKQVGFAEGTKLEEIGRYAFAKSDITSFIVPDTVTNIDYYAFSDTLALTEINLGNGEKLSLQGNAFYNSGLTEVTIPAGVDYIGELCFAGCENLTAIHVSADNKKYSSDENILYDKAQTKLITCPANKEGSYTIKSTVTSFAFAAFEKSKLSEITIPDDSKLSTIGYRAFFDCENLEMIYIPAGIQSIDRYAFAYCNHLKNVDIDNGSQLGGIYKSAFYNCEKLESIAIPDGVQEIGEYAFYGCSALSDLGFTETSNLMSIDDHAFEHSGVTSFTMPNDLIEIGTAAFNGAKLDTLVMNNSIQEIGRNAFADCGLAKMTKLEFPTSVTFLGNGALKGADTIEELTLPFFGEYLGDESANGFIKSVRLVDLFSQQEWTNIGSLKKISVLQGEFVPNEYCMCVNQIEQVVLPNTIVEIGYCAFESTALKQIKIPEGVSAIGANAFSRTSLEKLSLPKGLSRIGDEAFEYCSKLSQINLPDETQYIGYRAFAGTSLQSIIIPENVNYIGEGAFGENEELETIEVHENNKKYTSVDGILYNKEKTKLLVVPMKISGTVHVPEGIKEIGDYCFAGGQLEEIELPNTVTTIGRGAFKQSALLKFVMPDSVVSIDQETFMDCHKLEYVILSKNITEITSNMFSYDENLQSVEIYDKIKKIEYAAFRNSGIRYINFGEAVKDIGELVFAECNQLQYINVDEDNPYLRAVDGILYNKECTRLILTPAMISGEITVPDGVKKLEESAFSGRERLTKIVLPDSLEYVGRCCFLGCKRLSSISMGENITYIGQLAFGNTAYYRNEENWNEGILYYKNYALDSKNEKINKIVRVKEGTRLIASACFAYSHNMEKVILPDSVIYLNSSAFSDCDHLASVRMSRNLKKIGPFAFSDCKKLYSIVLPETLISHEDREFYNCMNLKYVICEADLSKREINSSSMFENDPALECIWVTKMDDATRMNFYDMNQEVDIIVDTKEKALAIPSDGYTIYSHVKLNDDKRIDNLYYDGEWNQATFWLDDMILQMQPVLSTQVLQAPAQSLINQYLPDGAEFIGWDIDGDGKADKLPSTLNSDLTAYAVYDTPIQSITLPETVEVEEGYSKKLTVTYTPEEYSHDDTLVWKSSDKTIATVQDGTVKGITQGEAVITASLKEDPSVQTKCTVTVRQVSYGIKLEETFKEINVGEKYQIPAEIVMPKDDADITEWFSNDETIAVVSSSGAVTAVAPGETYIIIRHGAYQTNYWLKVFEPLKFIEFKDSIRQMNVGDEKKLQISYYPENTSDDKSITWISTDTEVIGVGADGTVTAKGPGCARIIALVSGKKCEMEVRVYAPLQWIKLNTSTGTMRLERKKELSIIYEPENTTDDKTAVWESSDEEIASVDAEGVVTALKTGKATITATVGDKKASYEVTVVGLKDDKTGIIVSNSDDSEMDKDMSLGVDEITKEALQKKYPKGWEIFWKIIQEIIKAAKGHKPITPIFDIGLYQNNQAVQPGQSVDVEIPVPDGAITDDAVIYRIEEDGTVTDMHAEYKEGKFTFQTEHFSVYALGTKSEQIYTTDILFDNAELTVCPGRTATIGAVSVPENITQPGIRWRSLDESVAKVSQRGVVTAVKAGVVTISAIAVDDENVTAECRVRVEHDYVEPVIVKRPNCSEQGLAVTTCKVCDDTIEATLDKEPNQHIWGESYIIDKEPTETEEGQKSLHCSLCDTINPESITVIPKVTLTPSSTPKPTATALPIQTPSSIPKPTATVLPTQTPSSTPKSTATALPTPTSDSTPKPTDAALPTLTPSSTPKSTATVLPTQTPSSTPNPTTIVLPTQTPSSTPKPTTIVLPTQTPSSTPKPTATVLPTQTPSSTPKSTATALPTQKPKPTATVLPTQTPSSTPKSTAAVLPTQMPDSTPKPTDAALPTQTPSSMPTPGNIPNPIDNMGTDINPSDPVIKKIVVKDGITYWITADGSAEYQKADGKAKGSVVIPNTVKLQGKKYKVTSIAAKAFYNNKKIKKIVIGKNVIKIGKKAFYGCSKLQKILIRSEKLSAGKVGKKAFYKIYKKAVVKVPSKCKKQYVVWLKKTGITGGRKIH